MLSTAATDMPEPPLTELALRNGVLVHITPSLPETEYLTIGMVRVTGKANLVELPNAYVMYLFALSEGPDPTWIHLFAANLGSVEAEIHGAQLEIRCMPEELEHCYNKSKELIARTNEAYAAFKADLSERVAQHAADQQRAQRASDERTRSLRAQFDRLVI